MSLRKAQIYWRTTSYRSYFANNQEKWSQHIIIIPRQEHRSGPEVDIRVLEGGGEGRVSVKLLNLLPSKFRFQESATTQHNLIWGFSSTSKIQFVYPRRLLYFPYLVVKFEAILPVKLNKNKNWEECTLQDLEMWKASIMQKLLFPEFVMKLESLNLFWLSNHHIQHPLLV